MLNLGFLALPFAAGEPVKLGRLAFRADIFLYAVQLICRHIQLVCALIADVQEIPIRTVAGQAHGAHILADAVILVHHIVAHLEIGKGGQFFAAARAAMTFLTVDTIDVGFRNHGKANLRV